MNSENYTRETGVAQLHFDEGVRLPVVIRTLQGAYTLYSEMAVLDSIHAEVRQTIAMNPDSEVWAHDSYVSAAGRLLHTCDSPDYDASFAILNTDYDPAILTARGGGSWIIDLVGALNPIKTLMELLEFIRDWRSNRKLKQGKVGRLVLDLMQKDIEVQMSQVKLIRETADLLRSGGADGQTITKFIRGRVSKVTEGLVLTDMGVHAMEVREVSQYKEMLEAPGLAVHQLKPSDIQYQIDHLLGRQSVWSLDNQLLNRLNTTDNEQ